MKQLTKEQLSGMRSKPPGRASFARIAISNMKPGDIILLEPKDWNQKRSPHQLIRRLVKKSTREFTCLKSLDEPGWIIERVK